MPSVYDHAMVYDTHRSQLVVYGGLGFADQTWEFDGSMWRQRSSTPRPPPSRGHAMAYDEVRRQTVLFGGNGTNGTWLWNGDHWTLAATSGPSPRDGHALTWDANLQRVLLFGGRDTANTANNETWVWDGASWTQLTPTNAPSPRWGHALCHDGPRRRTVLAGGYYGIPVSDTWEFDGQDWSLRSRSVQIASDHQQMAFDSARQRCVYRASGDQQVWEWDGSTWSSRADDGGRSRFALCYHAGLRRVVRLGGYGVYYQSFATSVWDGVIWADIEPPTRPTPSSFHCMAYDSARGEVVLLNAKAPYERATWRFDGTRWLFAQTPGPYRIAQAAMAYQTHVQRIVLFGGRDSYNASSYSDITWEWDGRQWLRRTPSSAPSARADFAMAYQGLRATTLLFGGRDQQGVNDEIWEWDGALWQQRTPSTRPAARGGHVMAFDSRRNVVVLFGGGIPSGTVDDTWEWNGTNWTQVFPNTRPPARMNAAMVFDERRGRTILHGGFDSALRTFSDTWEWDGVNWTPLSSTAIPRLGHGIAYHQQRQQIVVFGGKTSFSTPDMDDTWLFGDLTAADTAPLGFGCSGSAGVPLITSPAPRLGTDINLQLLQALPNAPCAFLLSTTNQQLPLGPCTLYLGAPLQALPALTNSGGVARLDALIPSHSWLSAGIVFAQAVVADPQGSFSGLAFTPGWRLILGE